MKETKHLPVNTKGRGGGVADGAFVLELVQYLLPVTIVYILYSINY